MVFFCVGRLFRQRSIDHLAWFLPLTSMVIYLSVSEHHYSLSLFQLHCIWPWSQYLFIFLFVLPILSVVFGAHIRYAIKNKLFKQKLVEFALGVALFIVPFASNPYFHLHHYYIGWVFGMHANFDVWWSRVCLALSWAFYVNGIATWGRDPILGCALSLYRSTGQSCPYMTCYHELPHNDTTRHQDVPTSNGEQPNWRNCSGFMP